MKFKRTLQPSKNIQQKNFLTLQQDFSLTNGTRKGNTSSHLGSMIITSKKTNKWAECFSKLCASTNNGLESTNAIIKEHKTLCERLQTNVFPTKMVEIASEWSRRRDSTSINSIKFSLQPSISLDVWTRAFHLAIDQDQVFICRVLINFSIFNFF